ncbi:histidine phosphatase family protein [Streptomyces sp. Ru73]|uniref:histidine phosphatase family protein n=1 Tax=Streptomyces sp. Ru73 TaxID=2080748 RepID=UPI000CDD50A2|nr:histidine phosphatase family protein [Streptomyces sp. Ru73]POX36705.1 histidine phosphatase family protein [Streptomyces sp. Ru73]
MSELLLIRHGETEWSRSGQHTSWTDLPLTGRGEEQARELGPLLAGRKVGLTLVSPMARARRTAELAGLTRFEVEPDLMEWDYGAYEGVCTVDIHRTRPEWFLFTDGVPPGPEGHPGESPEEVGARADRVLARLAPRLAADGDGDVALVGHAHFLRVLTARRLGLPASAGALFTFETGAVGVLGTEHDRPAVVAWNTRTP